MASRIKGITVEIGGDTTGLDKALKSVNTTIKNTQSSLKDVNKLLKLDLSTRSSCPKNEAPEGRHRRDQGEAGFPEGRAGAGKAQLESGDLGQDKYDALQRKSSRPRRSSSACRSRLPPPAPASPRLTRSVRRWNPSATASPEPENP